MRVISERLGKLKERGEGALIAYVCGGDPKPKYTPEIVDALIRGGADIIELGLPFSDPIADGPTIQAASVRALKTNTIPTKVLEIAGIVKEKHSSVPLILLSYYNPIFHMGLKRFFRHASESLVDGIIIPDLPVEEADEYKLIAEDHGIDTIFLVTPNTTTDRLERIIDYTSGFLYLVSIFGITGARNRVHRLTLQTMRRLQTYIGGRIPMAVGFGISKPEHVRTIISSGADGAIVGSALVQIIEKYENNIDEILRALEEKVSKLKDETMPVCR